MRCLEAIFYYVPGVDASASKSRQFIFSMRILDLLVTHKAYLYFSIGKKKMLLSKYDHILNAHWEYLRSLAIDHWYLFVVQPYWHVNYFSLLWWLSGSELWIYSSYGKGSLETFQMLHLLVYSSIVQEYWLFSGIKRHHDCFASEAILGIGRKRSKLEHISHQSLSRSGPDGR